MNPTGFCLCGCGTPVAGFWKRGHVTRVRASLKVPPGTTGDALIALVVAAGLNPKPPTEQLATADSVCVPCAQPSADCACPTDSDLPPVLDPALTVHAEPVPSQPRPVFTEEHLSDPEKDLLDLLLHVTSGPVGGSVQFAGGSHRISSIVSALLCDRGLAEEYQANNTTHVQITDAGRLCAAGFTGRHEQC